MPYQTIHMMGPVTALAMSFEVSLPLRWRVMHPELRQIPLTATGTDGPLLVPTAERDAVMSTGLRLGPSDLRAVEYDIDAWESELRRKRMSEDYCQRGPALIRSMVERFGWRTTAEATTAQVCEWLAEKGGSGQAQNNRLAIIRSYFHFCERVTKTTTANPAKNIERSGVAAGDGVREFSQEEMAAIFGAARGHWRTAVGILCTTALRRGAVFRNIRCGYFDPERRVLAIPAGVLKNRKAQEIPLNDDAFALLTEATANRGPDEFVVPIGFDSGSWLALLERAGVKRRDSRGRPCGIHSFRKGVLTLLACAGVHPRVTQDIAGHSDPRLTMKSYIKFGMSQQADALKKLPSLSPAAPTGYAGFGSDSVGKRVDKASDVADAVTADRNDAPMRHELSQPCQNTCPRIGTSDDQHACETVRGHAFQQGCDATHSGFASSSMTPRGFEPPAGRGLAANPTGLQDPVSVVLGALGELPAHQRRSLLIQLLALLTALGIVTCAALACRGSEPHPAVIVDRPTVSGRP